ncbi:MAG: tripartite tricarboxylate transporter TctB family protein [Rhizobium sp.]|nr:tripartite tricarboxylate transporter TctB family protein [Rhizobium sp.]
MKQETRVAGIVAGLLLALLGLLIAWSTWQMKVPFIHAKVGPQYFSYAAAFALAVCGAGFILQALRHGAEQLVADTDDPDWKALGLITAGFVFEMIFIKMLGFILASSILFVAVSIAFGSRKFLRDVIIALIVCSIAYFTFTKFLNLQLPAGFLGGLF